MMKSGPKNRLGHLHTVALLAALASSVSAAEWKVPNDAPLLTRWVKDVSPTHALPEYPRPLMVRERWQNLNGLWDYAITGKNEEKIPAKFDGSIIVPYPIESALSGVMRPLKPDQRLWYRRTFTIPKEWSGQRILLHFGAVDWQTTVFLNGRELGGHRGGYDAFSFDLSRALLKEASNELVVSVWDPTDTTWHLSGKQTLKPGGCSYTASSGIWQTVWLEPVPLTTSIETIHAVPDLDLGLLHLTVTGRVGNEPLTLVATAFDGDRKVTSAMGKAGFLLWPGLRDNKVQFYKNTGSWFTTDLALPIKDAKTWSPTQPFLYDLTVTLEKDDAALDTVKSYFGMRSLGKRTDPKGFTRFLLNGQPTLMVGALDQGFWPDGLYTAATDEALKHDVEIAKEAGLNIIRKHVKVEPERFYYWCDKLGLMVLQDMPTGKEGDPKTDLPASPEAAAQCELEKRTLIQQRWNHPAIIAWCPFNEGWGQHDTLRYALWIKALDPSRLVDEASGFPWHGGGDIQDNHGGVSRPNPRQIGIVSENGGFGLATPGHDWPCDIWTYHSYDPHTGGTIDVMKMGLKGDRLPKLDQKSKDWFTKQVARLYADLWTQKDSNGMTGQFFCQLYDTESECDGLVSYDRAVWKVDPEVLRAAATGKWSPGQVGVKGRRFNVRNYGAQGDGTTDDSSAMARAMEAAIREGQGTTVFIPAGRYLLGTPKGGGMMAIANADGLTLEGEPGTMLIAADPTKHVISINQSRNVTVRRLEMDRHPLVFTQGRIDGLDPAARTVAVTIDQGYDEPDAKYLDPLKSFLVFTDPKADTWDHSRWWPTIVKKEQLAPRKWRFTLSLPPLTTYAGKRFLLWDNTYKGFGVNCTNSKDILIEDVRYYGGGADAGFLMWSCPGDVTLRRFKVGIPPGSDRLLASAGGSQEFQNRGTLTLEECDFSRIDDDGVNMGTTYAKVLRQVDPRTIVVQGNGIPFQTGDTITLWDWFKKNVRQEVRLQAFAPEGGSSVRLTLDADVKVDHPAGSPGLPQRSHWDGRGRFEEFDGIDRIADQQAAGKLIVRHCRFQTMRARNILVKGSDALIENNTFYNTHMTSILAGPEFYWGEGPTVRNLVIRNNRFMNIDGSSINLGCHHSDESFDNRNILIEGNTFEGYGNLGGISLAGKQGTAVLIRNADGVIVRNNTFGPPSPTAPRGAKPLLIEVSRNVVSKDNQGLPEAAQPEESR